MFDLDLFVAYKLQLEYNIEKGFLSTKNICSNWWIRKYLKFYAKKVCLMYLHKIK